MATCREEVSCSSFELERRMINTYRGTDELREGKRIYKGLRLYKVGEVTC